MRPSWEPAEKGARSGWEKVQTDHSSAGSQACLWGCCHDALSLSFRGNGGYHLKSAPYQAGEEKHRLRMHLLAHSAITHSCPATEEAHGAAR